MKANLKIEAIGYNSDQKNRLWTQILDEISDGLGDTIRMPRRYWVAEITGKHPVFKFERTFLKGKTDYKTSNSMSSRGVFLNYILESGHIYEASHPTSWKSTSRYFATVSNTGEIIRHRSYEGAKAFIESERL
jgi:hypothetical protein